MLELGKPIHTFDAAAVHDGRIIVRLARPGERLETLDHVVRDLHPETLLIADPAGPIAIAGVMGGATSEVGPTTTDVVVESAIFDPVSIRRTAFRYALRSDASLRFEKGQESRLAQLGADRTARLIAEWAGGTIATGVVDSNPVEPGTGARRVPARPREPPARDELRGRRAGAPAGSRRDRDGAGHPGDGRVRRRRHAPARAGCRLGRGRRGHDPHVAARPRGRGRHHRGDHPGPRLRTRAAPAPAHADAAVPARPARGARRRPRDPGRRRADRGRDVRARVAGDGRAVPGRGRRRARRGAGPARDRAAGRRHEPALEPARRPAPEPRWAACSRSCRRTCDTAARTSPSSRSARATGPPTAPRTSGGGSASP